MNVVDAVCNECGQPTRWLSGSFRQCKQCAEAQVERQQKRVSATPLHIVVVFVSPDGFYLLLESSEVVETPSG
jgi:hypothetical protein